MTPSTNSNGESSSHPPLLDVHDLRVYFPSRRTLAGRVSQHVKAVDDVSFHIHAGETLGLVGESGCGKTTVGRTVLKLIPATSGSITFDGRSLLDIPSRQLRSLRKRMQIVFQDPAGSLNPRLRIRTILGEPLRIHREARGKAMRRKVDELLERCGLPTSAASRFPHEFSGGQRQRIAIARALALNPSLIVCDEPTSALDVSVQAHILNLLKDLQQQFDLSYLFISHDMAVVNHMCDRIAVMFNGKIVETNDRESIIRRPQHDYTKTLLAAVPEAEPRDQTTSNQTRS